MNTPPDTMNESHKIRITQLSILPRDEPIFSEQCTTIAILDEGNGEFLELVQQSGSFGMKEQTIQINPEEWPQLSHAIEWMMTEIRDNEPNDLPQTPTKHLDRDAKTNL
jgi:hypothetical protein